MSRRNTRNLINNLKERARERKISINLRIKKYKQITSKNTTVILTNKIENKCQQVRARILVSY